MFRKAVFVFIFMHYCSGAFAQVYFDLQDRNMVLDSNKVKCISIRKIVYSNNNASEDTVEWGKFHYNKKGLVVQSVQSFPESLSETEKIFDFLYHGDSMISEIHITLIRYPKESLSINDSVHYYKDNKGRFVMGENNAYDKLGRVISRGVYLGKGTNNKYRDSLYYDKNNHMVKMERYWLYYSDSTDYSIQYKYANNKIIEEIDIDQGKKTRYTYKYNKKNLLVEVSEYDNANLLIGIFKYTYEYF